MTDTIFTTTTAIKPTSEHEIIQTLGSAKEKNLSVHCYSGGFNWGYGINASVDPHAVYIDLSKMNKIISFDPDLGILKIQPGVTQGQLAEYLAANNHDYYVPNTGAGERGSLLGNALERGFGISPHHDHASAILSVRGILGDGTIYESALKEIDPLLADCFTWGVGPQLDKMVSQSSWIILTEVGLQLKRRHECTDSMLLAFSDHELQDIMRGIRDLLSSDDGTVGSIKIFNKNQVLTKEMTVAKESMIFKTNNEWFLTLIIYSHKITRNSVLKMVKHHFSKYSTNQKIFFNTKKISWLVKFLEMLPIKSLNLHAKKLRDMNEMMKLASGFTSEVGYKALDINYDYNSKKLFDLTKFNKDLVWLSPICPLDPKRAIHLLEVVKKLNTTHPEFNFNTFTWTVLNQRTLALVIPILFEKSQREEFFKWYRNIHLELKKEGYIPYRFHTKMMSMVREELLPNYFKHVNKFEKAMDPDDIIERGRY
ncbi:MAG: FAD-dependent oxidoreductase [Bdellovibrionales bacterium]|nr:FAD-dependent oxidoreductase [Bdellovibrionales bacterium]